MYSSNYSKVTELWKSAIPSLFESLNLKLFQAAHSVQIDKWCKATLSLPRSARTKLDFPVMPVKLDGLNTPSDGWGIKPRAFRGLSFMSTKSTFNATPGCLLARWHSHCFSTNLYYDTALFINAAGFPTSLWVPQAKDSALSIYSSVLQRGCQAHGLLNERKHFWLT